MVCLVIQPNHLDTVSSTQMNPVFECPVLHQCPVFRWIRYSGYWVFIPGGLRSSVRWMNEEFLHCNLWSQAKDSIGTYGMMRGWLVEGKCSGRVAKMVCGGCWIFFVWCVGVTVVDGQAAPVGPQCVVRGVVPHANLKRKTEDWNKEVWRKKVLKCQYRSWRASEFRKSNLGILYLDSYCTLYRSIIAGISFNKTQWMDTRYILSFNINKQLEIVINRENREHAN